MEFIFNNLYIFGKEMWFLCVDMAPYILLGMLVSGIISVFMNSNMIFKHISKNIHIEHEDIKYDCRKY